MKSLTREELLDIAYQTFVGKTHVYDVLTDRKWEAVGIEGWVKTELIVALVDRGYNVIPKGIFAKDCDLIVNDVAVEVKASTAIHKNPLKDIIECHPKAEMYLSLSKTSQEYEKRLESDFEKKRLVPMIKPLNDNWIVMVAGRNNLPDSPKKRGCGE